MTAPVVSLAAHRAVRALLSSQESAALARILADPALRAERERTTLEAPNPTRFHAAFALAVFAERAAQLNSKDAAPWLQLAHRDAEQRFADGEFAWVVCHVFGCREREACSRCGADRR
jgi:hypothetical protein